MITAFFLLARIVRAAFITLRFAVSLAVLGSGALKWVALQRTF